ncbi:hypothetical protein FA15DRAFT_593878, partial [Coprinopsis marcescibilis]
ILAATTWLAVMRHSTSEFGWFTLHPLLQAFSLFQFAYSLVGLYYPPPEGHKNPLMPTLDLPQWALAFPATLVAGTVIVWFHKYQQGAEHGTTWHGVFGYTYTAWMIFQGLWGASSMLFKDNLHGGGPKAKLFWKYHNISGYVLFPAGLLTAFLGAGWSTWAKNNIYFWVRAGYVVMPLLSAAGFYLLWAREVGSTNK